MTSVARMSPVKVSVEVSNAFPVAQNEQPAVGATGRQVTLSTESDLVVIDNYSSDVTLSNNTEHFLNCLYNIEMKDAGKLKNSSTKPKSQLIAETLAKYLYRKDDPNAPKVIYSVLSDTYSLCFMIHFTEQQTAFLSHREIEPGRIVVWLPWLHRLAKKRANLTLSSFKEMKLAQVGGTLEAEIQHCVTQRRSASTGDGRGKGHSVKQQNAQRSSINNIDELAKKKPAKSQPLKEADDEEFRLEVVTSDSDDRSEVVEDETARRLSMFSALRNYHRFNDPLPAMEGIVHGVGERNKEGVKLSPYEQRMARFEASISDV
mgnify:CR=1 FL=1